ncbi:unnamed protein product [Eruca vesicaria subsp. sativa]|uniref:MADS-box domain-containing protein n=1 Tax=Eruca vesicaria subsp. sativa TaxID=29727 RepID=A0ABC8K3A6_ERUVS|nr:unnamed protein product [Eruca vesicaria subsp. sativa]
MGRVKIPMRKIASRHRRNITFAKRKNGLLKKAYELFILCDVQMVLIMFSPAGKLFIFDTKTRMEETIKKYMDMPIRPSRLPVPDEAYIRQWIDIMRLESHYPEPNEIENEIFKYHCELAKVEQQLGYFLKPPNQWATRDDIEYQEKLLEETLDKVRSRKKYLKARNEVFDAFMPGSN